MTSILKVSEIQDPTNSNTALTIDALVVSHIETAIDSCRLTLYTMATITGGKDQTWLTHINR